MKSVVVKGILSTVKSTDSYIDRDYNMNLYRGCTHGCIYCDSRSACYHIDNFDEVKVQGKRPGYIGKRAQRQVVNVE